jgi:hypothetical protein
MSREWQGKKQLCRQTTKGEVFIMVTIQHLSKNSAIPKDVVEIEGLIEHPTGNGGG